MQDGRRSLQTRSVRLTGRFSGKMNGFGDLQESKQRLKGMRDNRLTLPLVDYIAIKTTGQCPCQHCISGISDNIILLSARDLSRLKHKE